MTICHACGVEFTPLGTGPAKWCPECRPEQSRLTRTRGRKARYYARREQENAARQEWREENRERELATQRARYERERERINAQNRDWVARRKAAPRCVSCEEVLRQPSPSGLCGFCEMESAA